MGRPFNSELANLAENIAFALAFPVESLEAAIHRAMRGRILTCGAGGSFSAAAFTQLLLHTVRVEAQNVSPLYVLQMPRPIEPTTLFLFSARGRNKDVLRVVERATNQGIIVLLVCATTDSPAANLARRSPLNTVFEFNYPAARDGFLAVNSLAVTWWLLSRAFGILPPNTSAVEAALTTCFDVTSFAYDRRHACLIIHDFWTHPVAVDIESKMAEAALCAPLVSDWRQFGHGRHHWLAKNAQFSSVLSLESEPCKPLIEKSLELLPQSIGQTRVSSETQGIPGVCLMLIKSFVLIRDIGIQVGIDPGRPGVPGFGSALYHLAPMRTATPKSSKNWNLEAARQRKLDTIRIHDEASKESQIVHTACERYLDRICSQRFGAVVLDFDGTLAKSSLEADISLSREVASNINRMLHRGIAIGIATGRGDSCHGNLANTVPAEFWSQVHICHYNGASIGNLRDLIECPINWANDPVLAKIHTELLADSLLSSLSQINFKGAQITLRAKDRAHVPVVESYVRAFLAKNHATRAKIVASSHTLDIIGYSSTKVRLIEYLRKQLNEGCDILTIGDRGDLYGNDFELLANSFSLSVDRVSTDLDSCWNYLPRGVSHEQGTAWYLDHARLSKGYFKLASL